VLAIRIRLQGTNILASTIRSTLFAKARHQVGIASGESDECGYEAFQDGFWIPLVRTRESEADFLMV